MKIVVASGKGGTGKTTISVNFAHYLSNYEKLQVKLLDCDVEAPNDNLFVNANFTESFAVTEERPEWDATSCSLCGKCVDVCQYNAIAKVKDKILIFNELCHSCGACTYLCPEKSLETKKIAIGKIELAPDNKPFSFGHGILNIGESLAPSVIKKLKEQMDDSFVNIIDASPGTTCPVVKSMEDMDFCLLVTEPTPFGLNDLKLAASLAEKMKLPTGILINRSYGKDFIIEEFAKSSKIPIIGKIPFDRKYAESYSKGEILIEKFVELKEVFANLYREIQTIKSIPQCEQIEEKDVNITHDYFTINGENSLSEQYKEMVVISGKGGTGKTTITSAFAELMDNKVLADNDVDASNLHLLCEPTVVSSGDFIGGKSYIIDQESCIKCGKCEEVCNFDAVKITLENNEEIFRINELSCEGCGFCLHVCNSSAISTKDDISGKWYISETKYGAFSHAKLGIGEENSGKLVSFVRENASKLASSNNAEMILSDGPPGTGCPVIASISGVDLALIVTEPTLSGIHDMKRALDLTKFFNIRSLIVVNKFDLNISMTDEIIGIAKSYKTKVIGKVPFDKGVNDSLMNGVNIINYGKGDAYKAILELWDELKIELKKI